MKTEYSAMSDKDLIARLTTISVNSPKAAMVLAALTDDNWFDAVVELRQRYNRREVERFSTANDVPATKAGRIRKPTSVEIDPDRFTSFFYGKRIPISHIGRYIGYSDCWGSTVRHRKTTSFEAMDRLAVELDMDVDDLIWAVGSDRERARVGLDR